MQTKKFQIADLVWAKMKGYPYWPGKVIGVYKNRCYIYFFGTKNYAYVNKKHICSYKESAEQFSQNIKNRNLDKAVKEIVYYIEHPEESSDEDVSLNSEIDITDPSNEKLKDKGAEGSSVRKKKKNTGDDQEKCVISVSIHDKEAIKKLIPKDLRIKLLQDEVV